MRCSISSYQLCFLNSSKHRWSLLQHVVQHTTDIWDATPYASRHPSYDPAASPLLAEPVESIIYVQDTRCLSVILSKSGTLAAKNRSRCTGNGQICESVQNMRVEAGKLEREREREGEVEGSEEDEYRSIECHKVPACRCARRNFFSNSTSQRLHGGVCNLLPPLHTQIDLSLLLCMVNSVLLAV